MRGFHTQCIFPLGNIRDVEPPVIVRDRVQQNNRLFIQKLDIDIWHWDIGGVGHDAAGLLDLELLV